MFKKYKNKNVEIYGIKFSISKAKNHYNPMLHKTFTQPKFQRLK